MGILSDYDGPIGRTPPIHPLAGVGAGTPVIPKLYWDAYDDEQRIKMMWECFGRLADLYNSMVDQVNDNTATNDEIEETFERIKNGEYADGYIDQLSKWVDANLQSLVARLAQYVFPGFYWDGKCWRYQLIVPEEWTFLRFEFVWVPDDLSYHINLRWGDFSSHTDSSLQTFIDYLSGYTPTE